MRRHEGRSPSLTALAVSLVGAIITAAVVLALVGVFDAPASSAAQPPPAPISARVSDTTSGQTMPPGFVGVSVEFTGVPQYAGLNPHKVNPVFVQLLRNLAPAQHPVLRIGGDSTDSTWWPTPHVKPSPGITYPLTPNWLATTRALAKAAGARLIVGVNLAARQAALAASEGRALLKGIGRRYVQALEIGNEPDVYNVFPWYYAAHGRAVLARGHRYGLKAFGAEFGRWSRLLPKVGVAGPAFAELTWLYGLGKFIASQHALKIVTLHRYPLRAGVTDPTSTIYPSVANLLSDRASSGLASEIAPSVALAHAHHLPLRLDELNSASHFGQRGVSDTFASALWVLDTLFNLASVDTDGVNVHSRPDAAYGLFSFNHPHSGWRAFVHPEYYGMLMFEQAFPPGARLLEVSAPSGPVKVWATRLNGRVRVVLINKDRASSHQLQLQLPGAGPGAHATLERLLAPKVTATGGVTLGGQSFGTATRTGKLPPPHTQTLIPSGGSYAIGLPAASAALLTQ